jgi:tetratricopeptide (TPR) repeat protein
MPVIECVEEVIQRPHYWRITDNPMSDIQAPPATPSQPTKAQMLLAEGLQYHQAGHLNRAEDCYRGVLENDPHPDDAIQLIQKAISIRADNPVFYANLAIVLNVARREAEAEAACRTGLELAPENTDMLNSLAHALSRQGHFPEAEEAYRKGVSVAPDHATLRSNLAILLMEGGRLEEAEQHLNHAIKIDPKFVAAHASIAVVYRTLGRLEEAEAACRRAILVDPSYILGHLNLGTVLFERQDFAGADKAYRDALRLAPDNLEALTNLAAIAGMRGFTNESLKIYRRLLSIDPRAPEVHNAIALVHLNAGGVKEAVAGFKRAIELEPLYFEAYYNLVYAPDNGFGDATVDHLTPYLETNTTSPDDKIRLRFTVGEIRRRQGTTARAWPHFEAGNDLRREMMRVRGAIYSHDVQAARAKTYFEIFDEAFFAEQHDVGSTSERPVFVVGVPRSGTSLVEQVLASHPAVFGAGEINDISLMINKIRGEFRDDSFPGNFGEIPPARLRQFGQNYISHITELGKSAERVVDKSPFNYRQLGVIAKLFPKARIIYCRRDPADTGLSCYMHNFAPTMPWACGLEDIGYYIGNYEAYMAHWRRTLPISIHEVQYESLVANPETEIRRLIEYIDLPWDDSCLAPHRAQRIVQSAARWQVRQPITDQWIGQAAAYQEFLGPLKDSLETHNSLYSVQD